jgi:hypothetical protein
MATLVFHNLDLTAPIRAIIARIYALLYMNGDTRHMYDTVGALQTLVGARNTKTDTRM